MSSSFANKEDLTAGERISSVSISIGWGRTARGDGGRIPFSSMSSVAGGKRPLSALCTCVCV